MYRKPPQLYGSWSWNTANNPLLLLRFSYLNQPECNLYHFLHVLSPKFHYPHKIIYLHQSSNITWSIFIYPQLKYLFSKKILKANLRRSIGLMPGVVESRVRLVRLQIFLICSSNKFHTHRYKRSQYLHSTKRFRHACQNHSGKARRKSVFQSCCPSRYYQWRDLQTAICKRPSYE